MLANVVKCFLDQTYTNATLHVLDDASTFDTQSGDRWLLTATGKRYPSLWLKYNELIKNSESDIIVIWEDDDVYLPDHLKNIADVHQPGLNWYLTRSILSTHKEPIGSAHYRDIGPTHHGSWAYNRAMIQSVGGYTDENVLNGDMRLRPRLLEVSRPIRYGQLSTATYVYRWQRGLYNGSQRGQKGWSNLWKRLGKRKVPHVGRLIPAYDSETRSLIEGVRSNSFSYNLPT